MNAHDALRRLCRALDRLQRDPQAKLRLVLANGLPGIARVALTGLSSHHGMLTVQLEAEPPAWRPADP